MSDDTARFGLVAEDGVSGPAAQAARELQKLQASIDKDTKSLAAMNKAMSNLNKATKPNTGQITALKKQIDATKESIAGAQSKLIDLGGTFSKKPKPSGVGKQTKTLVDELSNLPGPLGKAASMFSSFIAKIGTGRAVLLGLAAGLVAVAGAAVVAANKLVDMAIASQNARRNELLQLEAAGKIRTLYSVAFGGAADKAKDMQAAIDQVSGTVSISRERVAQYGVQLEKLGVRGKNFKTALEAASIAGSVSEEQGARAAEWSAQIARVGGSVDKVAQRYKNQFGGLVQKQMLSLEVQQKKLQESQDALFAGVDIEPLLKAKKGFNDLFSQSTASGRIMQRWLGTLLQPFINGIETTVKVARTAVLKLLIIGAKIEGKWLDFRLALRGGAEGMKKFFKEGIGQSKYFLVIFAPVVAVFAYAATVIDTLIGLFKYLGRVVSVIANGGDWAELGVSLIDGVKEGITDRKNIIAGAVTGIGEDLLGDFRSVFGIQSPSKVMMSYGRDISKGLAIGIAQGKAEAASAMVSVAPLPDAPAAGAESNLQARAAISIGTISITVGAGAQPSDAKDIGAAIKRELENILQTVAVQMGAPA